jgi:hypothetical protein
VVGASRLEAAARSSRIGIAGRRIGRSPVAPSSVPPRLRPGPRPPFLCPGLPCSRPQPLPHLSLPATCAGAGLQVQRRSASARQAGEAAMVGRQPPAPPKVPPRSSESRMNTKGVVKRTRKPSAKMRALANLNDIGGSGSATAPGESPLLPLHSSAGSISVDKEKVCVQNLDLSLLHA